MNPKYTKEEKIIFELTLYANLVAGKTGTVPELEKELYDDINTQLKQREPVIGPWSIFWGPAIYQAPESQYADNSFYLARQEGADGEPDKIVVAIAGTNGTSIFGWLILDFWVANQVPWPWGNPPGDLDPKIAMGTMIGLSQIQHLEPGDGLPGAGIKFRKFLKDNIKKPTILTTGGISLGGALSPVTALWLLDTQEEWDHDEYFEISCIPTAGPTPGNKDFANYYDQPEKLGNRTTRIHNDLDMVPHAWNLEDLAKVPGLYEPYIDPGVLVDLFAFLASIVAKEGDYVQIQPSAPPIDSQVNQDLIDPKKSDFVNFMTQALYQHIMAYMTYMDKPHLEPIAKRIERAANLHGPDGHIEQLKNLLKRKQDLHHSFKK